MLVDQRKARYLILGPIDIRLRVRRLRNKRSMPPLMLRGESAHGMLMRMRTTTTTFLRRIRTRAHPNAKRWPPDLSRDRALALLPRLKPLRLLVPPEWHVVQLPAQLHLTTVVPTLRFWVVSSYPWSLVLSLYNNHLFVVFLTSLHQYLVVVVSFTYGSYGPLLHLPSPFYFA